MAFVIAGERSGVGKTTVTLALLAALSEKYQRVQSFKVGPDYIDPMFHQAVTRQVCRTLDPVLTTELHVQQCFAQHTQVADCSLVEGVMGLFDGASTQDDFASTAHIARLLNLPVVLVLDCSRLSRSVAAIAHGYRSLDPRITLAGVVLNRVGSDRHLAFLKSALTSLHLPILGVLHRQDNITIPDRHLGLVPTAEILGLRELIDRLAHLGHTCFDWSQLTPLLMHSPSTEVLSIGQTQSTTDTTIRPHPLSSRVRLAVAQDRAFSFYYADNLDLLTSLGAELIPWSPLSDPQLPEGVQGLYFGGGFPEVFAEQLADNQTAQTTVRGAISAGMPTYAECGGLMYLCQNLTDFQGRRLPMVGVLPADVVMGKRLTLGYRQAIAQQDTSLLTQGTTLWGHEFHRSHLTSSVTSPLFHLKSYDDAISVPSDGLAEGWALHQVHASYVHLHWGATPGIPARFLHHCQKFQPIHP